MWFYVEFIEHSSRNIAGMSSAKAQEKEKNAGYIQLPYGGYRDGQNHHMLMILKSNYLNKGDLKSKSFWKW